MNINIKYLNQLYNYFNNYKEEPYEIQILEPMSVVLTLVLISFKSEGTKISIINNHIYIQEPNIMQPINRWYYGHNREEIHYLFKPIFRSLETFKPYENENLQVIFKKAVAGLNILKKSYNNESSTICYTLDLYIKLIDNNLHDGTIMNVNYFSNNPELSVSTQNKFKDLFKSVWEDSEISLVVDIISVNEKSTINFIKTIENILTEKQKIIDKILIDTAKLI